MAAAMQAAPVTIFKEPADRGEYHLNFVLTNLILQDCSPLPNISTLDGGNSALVIGF